MRVGGDVDEAALKKDSITLDLTNRPLAEVLRYVSGLVGLRYRATAEGIGFCAGTTLFTKRYEVPSQFGDEEAVDPFLNDGVATKRPKSARELLMEMGIDCSGDV